MIDFDLSVMRVVFALDGEGCPVNFVINKACMLMKRWVRIIKL